MEITIVSWNCQGDSIGTISKSSGAILEERESHIILLQEAGSMSVSGKKDLVNIAGKYYTAYYKEQNGAENKRCTTGVLVDKTIEKEYAAKLYSKSITGVRRPLVICQLNINGKLIYVATFHATANQNVSDGEIELICNDLIKICSGLTAFWILMGDMNHEADHMQEVLKGSSCRVIAPDSFTQKSGGTLDYAIVANNIVQYINSLWVDNEFRESDHLAVKIRLNL